MRTLSKIIATFAAAGVAVVSPGATADAGSTLTCQGLRATIVGTDHRDHLVGTPRRDVIVARAGWDTVDAGAGDDVVCGGRGADTLNGGPGRDVLHGQGDGLLYDEDQIGDRVDGGAGNDRLFGGGGLYSGDRGLDVLVYPRRERALRVDLGAHVAQFGGQRDHVGGLRGGHRDDLRRRPPRRPILRDARGSRR